MKKMRKKSRRLVKKMKILHSSQESYKNLWNFKIATKGRKSFSKKEYLDKKGVSRKKYFSSKDKEMRELKCFKCKKLRHIKYECLCYKSKIKRRKKKVMLVAWSDNEEESIDGEWSSKHVFHGNWRSWKWGKLHYQW